MKRKYWVLWTYIGNYSDHPIEVTGTSPEDAIDSAVGFFSADFQAKATVYVFDHAPVMVRKASQTNG